MVSKKAFVYTTLTLISVMGLVVVTSQKPLTDNNSFVTATNRGSKVLTVESVDDSSLTLNNGWSPRITTSNISFGEGLFELGPDGYIQNIDTFRSIDLVTVTFTGTLYLDVSESDGAGHPFHFEDNAIVSGVPYDREDDMLDPFQFIKLHTDSGAVIYSITFTVTC